MGPSPICAIIEVLAATPNISNIMSLTRVIRLPLCILFFQAIEFNARHINTDGTLLVFNLNERALYVAWKIRDIFLVECCCRRYKRGRLALTSTKLANNSERNSS